MKTKIILVPGALLLLLSACQNNERPINPDFGNSVLHNKAVHIINPRTPNPAAKAPGMSGPRAVGVMQRYRAGNVKELTIEKTSSD